MAIQSNFPAIKPSLLLDFANTKTLDPRITFTRASTASYYDGVTTAMAEQNLFTYSQDYTNAAWTKAGTTITANSTTAPDGTTTASTVTASGGGIVNRLVQTNSSGTFTLSFYAKANTQNFIQLNQGASSNYFANFDLSTGTIGTVGASATATITSVGNGWYRCTMTVASATLGILGVYVVDSNTAAAFATTTSTNSFYLWGAQVEQRSSVSAYTATTTVSITNYIPKLQTAASGVARFDNSPTTGESLGLLIEEARTNLILQSQFASGWTPTRSTLSANQIIAPDGTLTGAKIIEDTTANSHFISQAVTIANTTAYTCTFYAKAGGRNWVTLWVTNIGTSANTYFDLQNGVLGSIGTGVTATITSVGNGWYRCSVTGTSISTSTIAYIGTATANNTNNVAGDGFSGVYIWGAQLEAGAFATSYIPTVASTVTRNAETATMSGTNFSSWYNQAEGSLYVDMTYDVSAQYIPAPRFYASAGANPNSMGFNNGTTTAISTSIRSNAVNVADMSKTVTLVGNHRMAFGYKINDAAFTVDNISSLSTATPVTLPTVDAFGIGGQLVGYYQGTAAITHIKKIAYYPIRMANTNILALTS